MTMKQKKAGASPLRADPELMAISIVLLLAATFSGAAKADETQIERGRYLTQIAGCSDCHTPGCFLGKPDMARLLGGSDVGSKCPVSGSSAVRT